MAFDGDKALDPNDPKVFTNPEMVALLDPRQQLIAAINMAETGQLVNGDQIRTLEIILKMAGYDIDINGQLSSEERAALDNFKDKLQDKDMVNAMNSMVEMMAQDVGKDWTDKVLGMFVQQNRSFLAPAMARSFDQS